MPLLTELDLVWVLELQRCRAYGAGTAREDARPTKFVEKCRAKGARAAKVFYGQNFSTGAMSICEWRWIANFITRKLNQ